MTTFNVVRFRVKPGRDEAFLDAHRRLNPQLRGMRRFSTIKTGDRAYCVIGEWESHEALVAARPVMIGMLDSFRDTLEDLGGGVGVTDPVSGDVVLELATN